MSAPTEATTGTSDSAIRSVTGTGSIPHPLATFDKITSVWGPVTMLAGLLAMMSGPVFLAVFGGFDVDFGTVAMAVVAIAMVFGVIWFVEPVSYFPILGPAAMYQAFLIGNISTKLLPSAMAAQTRIKAKVGTPKAQLAAAAAISAAGLIHVVSLILFVGLLGNWLLGMIPSDILSAVSTFIMPAVLGAFIVQAVQTNWGNKPVLLTGLVVAAVIIVVLLPLVPGLATFATLLGVVLTIAVVVMLPRKAAPTAGAGESTSEELIN
ncbi:hypothetical protein ACFFIO_00860 [Citricoccus parietis]|uniref:Branched-chain amino acid ABC transporter permease n=1 Tax=Citricoccus parietis TaxID=592307 RepID=A0ABV6F130_9MICC